MIMQRILAISGLLLMAASVDAVEKVVTAATLEDYSPYCFPIENSKSRTNETIPPGMDSSRLQGYSWDVLRASLHDQGYTIQLTIAPWARAFSMAEAGRVDILFPTGLNKERMEFFYYSREPINRADFLVYVKSDSRIEWKDLSSLDGLTIGEMRGWNFGDEWKGKNAIKKYEIGTILQGFKMLDAGRLDGLVGYEIPFDHALKLSGSKEVYKKLPPFDYSAEYVAGSKNNSNIVVILDDFDAGKREITKNGILDQVIKKWQK